MKRFSLSLCLLLIFSISLLGSDTLILSSENKLTNAEFNFYYDSLGTKSIGELPRDWRQNLSPVGSDFNPYKGNYWSQFVLTNDDDIDAAFVMTFHDWREVQVFELDSKGQKKIMQTGFMVPYKKRDYAFANNNHIRIHLKSGESKAYTLCLKSGADHWKKPSGTAFSISPRKVLDSNNHRDELIMGIFGGIFLFLFLYNLFIYLTTRDFEYVLYLARILILGYTLNANSGYIVAWFSGIENFPLYKGLIESFMSGLGPAVMIFFTMFFLNTKTNLPFWHKVLKFMLGGIIIMIIGVNINYTIFGPLTYLLSLLLTATFIIIGVRSIMKKVPSSWYYLIAYSFSTIAMFIVIFSFSGVLPRNIFTMNYVLPTGYSLELLFFSFALANKINILRRKSESQQSEIIMHLKEKEQMQANITQELERKVEERTKEINEQKELIEEERQKSEDLLMNILPEEAVHELKTTGKSKPKVHQSVSILFSDFKGFTNTASTIPAERLITELNDIFVNFDDIVEQNGVEKIKTIGDAYMAVSGLYDENENHASKIIKAAIEMQQYLEKRNANAAIKWNVRIGIHSGSVISGIVGKNKFTFDIWGDTVNIASRLESQCEVKQINVSAYTYDLAKEEYKAEYRGKIDAKGKGEIDMYYINY